MNGERKLSASDLSPGYEKEREGVSIVLIVSSQTGSGSSQVRWPLWDLDSGFAHPFTLGGTIFSGIFKGINSTDSVFEPDSPGLAFDFHKSVLL